MAAAIEFEQNKYIKLEQIIPKELVETLAQYIELKKKSGKLRFDPVVTADCLSHEPVIDLVLDYMGKIFSKCLNKELVPTYSFVRKYYPGAELVRHIDRPACEYSCTLPLSYTDGNDWPIRVTTDGDDSSGKPVHLNKGDALVYKGQEVFHWRDKLQSGNQTQIFLHYVDINGKNAEWVYDKREGLSMQLNKLAIFDDIDCPQELGQTLSHFLKQQLRIVKTGYYLEKDWSSLQYPRGS